MSYRFKNNEPVERGFRRIARLQLDIALAGLTSAEALPSGVHECRKALKRLRALVRLSEFALGSRQAKQRRTALGDIGRLLSERRDQAVLLETLDKLAAGSQGETTETLGLLRLHLIGPVARRVQALEPDCRDEVRARLLREAKKFSRLRFRKGGSGALREGLEKSYATARRSLKKAYRKPTDDNFHTLRKSIQWHWRQMSLMSRAWPEEFGVRVAAARELSQILGDERDLALVAEYANSRAELAEGQRQAVVALCHQRQTLLRETAKPRAARLLAETPKEFTKRVMTYWRLGRRIGADLEEGRAHPPAAAVVRIENSASEPPPAAAPTAPSLVATKAAGSAQSQRRV